MEEVSNNLKQWTIRFLKNKDLIIRRIVEIKESEEAIQIKYKEKDQELFIIPQLEKVDFNKIKQDGKGVITINNKKNLDFLLDNWKEFIQKNDFMMYFVNPFSKLARKWVIFPLTHNKVAEGQKIKEGLMSLYTNVEPISYEEYEKILKG